MTYDDSVLEALDNGGGEGHKFEVGDVTTAAIEKAVVKPHKSWEGVTEIEFVFRPKEGGKWTERIEIAPLTTREGALNQTALGIFANTMRKCGYDGKLSEVVDGAHEDIIGNTVTLEFHKTKKDWMYAKVTGLVETGKPDAVSAISQAFDGNEVAGGEAASDDGDIF